MYRKEERESFKYYLFLFWDINKYFKIIIIMARE